MLRAPNRSAKLGSGGPIVDVDLETRGFPFRALRRDRRSGHSTDLIALWRSTLSGMDSKCWPNSAPNLDYGASVSAFLTFAVNGPTDVTGNSPVSTVVGLVNLQNAAVFAPRAKHRNGTRSGNRAAADDH